MGTRHRLTRGALASLACAACAASALAIACSSKPVATTTEGGAPAARPPVDHLAPGELAEGTEKAFGLVLPRDMVIHRTFPNVIHASSKTARPEHVANYFRARVQDGTVSAGAAETKFIGVHAKAELTRVLAIEVRGGNPGLASCDVMVRDITPPPVEPGLTEEERRRRMGLSPDGKTLLDPKHTE